VATSDTLLTIGDLCDRWKVRPKVVYSMRYRHEAPPALKCGRELRWRLSDVEAWEEQRRDSGGPDRAA
jgi:predicted DNA-binding transcriptional regulator AlpA